MCPPPEPPPPAAASGTACDRASWVQRRVTKPGEASSAATAWLQASAAAGSLAAWARAPRSRESRAAAPRGRSGATSETVAAPKYGTSARSCSPLSKPGTSMKATHAVAMSWKRQWVGAGPLSDAATGAVSRRSRRAPNGCCVSTCPAWSRTNRMAMTRNRSWMLLCARGPWCLLLASSALSSAARTPSSDAASRVLLRVHSTLTAPSGTSSPVPSASDDPVPSASRNGSHVALLSVGCRFSTCSSTPQAASRTAL